MIEKVEAITTGKAPAGHSTPAGRSTAAPGPAAAPFDQVLSQAMRADQPLKFSAHAHRRLQSRDIQLGDVDMTKIERAVDKAGGKGSRESLVLLDDLAFVVSVRNRVVITALNVPDIKEGVVTNIDSVVIA